MNEEQIKYDKPSNPSRQFRSINTVSLAGTIASKVSRNTTTDKRDKCSFLVETTSYRVNEDGKLKEDKSLVLCKAFDTEALRLEKAQKGSNIMIAVGQIIGGFVTWRGGEKGEERYEQWVKIKEFSFYGEHQPEA